MKPFMQQKEINIIVNIIKKYKVKSVLEYGSGNSTLYFTKLFPNLKWYSIESNKEWYDKTKDHANVLCESNLDKYPEAPSKLKTKFDLIIIDGRVRKHCITISKNYLNSNGIVILHDANRDYYYPKEIPFKYQLKLLDSRKNLRMGDGGLSIMSDFKIENDFEWN